MLWYLSSACSIAVNWNTSTWIDSTEAETFHAGRIHLRKLQAHRPVTSSRAKISVSLEFSQCARSGSVLFRRQIEGLFGLSRPCEITIL